MLNNLTIEKAGKKRNVFAKTPDTKTAYALYIIITSLFACGILYYIEQGIGVSYIIKTLIKLFLFILIPGLYALFIRRSYISVMSKTTMRNKTPFLTGLLSGILFFIILMAAYYLLQSNVDFKPIISELQTKLKITPLNFIIVGAYITFVNSFIEEFFFRGFIFLKLYDAGYRISAYIFSALLFSLYHIMIFRTWFTLPILLLSIAGLAAVGLIFAWMDTKARNFLNSWIAHVFADSAIILIGLRMFNII